MVDEAQRVFFSVNVEDSHDIWFSKNMLGCTNCFGCINLRNKNYHIFNQPVSKEQYKQFIEEFQSGSFKTVEDMREKAEAFWLEHPNRFTLAINVVNSTGEHIEHCKNVKDSYFVHNGENLRYFQMWEDANDSYDCTVVGGKAALCYESVVSGFDVQSLKFCDSSISGCNDLEYSVYCSGSSNLFGCFGLQKKQYCILNKQYSKEEYEMLLPKIKQHMNDMPYTDKQGRIYKYGEFFPPEFSPFAYNETIAQDFSPLTKEEAQKQGYVWRGREKKTAVPTIKAADFPDNIADVQDDILKQIIQCAQCQEPFQIIPMELTFYRNIKLPLPRLCPDCRFARRFRFVNLPKFRPEKCYCAGAKDKTDTYENAVTHFHAASACPNEFETSYPEGAPEIIYCEQCYKSETI